MGAEADPKSSASDAKGTGEKRDSPVTKKAVRIVTVMAYASAVSGAGFLLSIYYIFLWDPQIRGVRPPGYLQSGEMIGMPQRRVASVPEALRGGMPIAYPHKMSKEFMDAFYKNDTGTNEPVDMEDPQPTPFVLPVVEDGLPPEDNSKAEHILPTGTAGATHQEPGDSSLHTNNVEQHSSRTHQDYRDTKHRRLQQPDTRGPLAANA